MRSALCALASVGAAYAQNPCQVRDRSYEVLSDCYFTTWQGLVEYSFEGNWGYYYTGWFQGRNECDPGGLNCDGSSRPFRLYKASKTFQSWPNPYPPDVAQFWWVVNDQYLQWESCQTPSGQPANRVTNYSFPRMTSWYQVWCN